MSSARYFQGTSVQGPVRESAARTFREVVDTLRVCPKLGITRSAFKALSEKERNEAKQVPFFVPATFRESPSKRSYDQALHCNLIFLDIDPEKKKNAEGKWEETGRYPAAPFVRDPALLSAALEGYNFVAHLTASSTPEKPRMRIVVDAEKIPVSEYPRAVQTIAALLGLPSITRESTVAVQPMFLPTLFHDSPADYDPILAYSVDGRAFRLSDISDSLDSYHGSNGKNGTHGSNGSRVDAAASADALEFLRAPVPEVTLGIAREALFAIDPDISYHEWLDLAAALRHQFSPHKEAEAYELFDEWSSKGSKYAGADETEAKWKSLKPSPVGRLPITIRTLLHRAIAAGWDEKKVKENVFLTMTEWLEQVPTVMELLEQGVKRIVAVPLITSMQEDLLVSKLVAQAKKRFAHTISPTSVRKDLARVKQEMQAQTEKPQPLKEEWAKDVAFIIAADEFFRFRTGERIKRTAFNSAYARFLLPTKQQLVAQGIAVTPATLSKPIVLPEHYALNHLTIPTAQDYAYDPSQPNEKFFVINGSRVMNIYNPTYPLEDPKRADWAGQLLWNHLCNLIAEEDNRRRLLDFMAYQVQFPGRKIRHAVLVQSVEGGGKTFLAEVMKAVLGAEHVKTIDGASIKSGFNEWAFGKQVIVIEEVRVVGTSKHEIMNALKPLITNRYVSVNEKFRNNREVENISNYFLFSNHHDALALTPGDRRYFVIKSPLQTKAQVLALGDDYFGPLFGMLRLCPGALRSFLLNWEISPDFDPDGPAPRTKYVQDMVDDSSSDLATAVRQAMLEGDVPLIQYDIVSANILKTYLAEQEGMRKVTTQELSKMLREEGLLPVGRHLIGDTRHYLWSRPGIREIEAAFTAADREKRQLKNLEMQILY